MLVGLSFDTGAVLSFLKSLEVLVY